MELRHLRYFVAVAEERHFTRAAQRLHIAQPPLSQQVKALEREVGTPLLHRTSRRVDLTEAGREFLPYARRALADADSAIETARRAARGETGHLRIGFIDSAGYDLLPRLVLAFRAAAPDVRLDLQEMSTPRQLAAIGDGVDARIDARIDLGVDVGIVREADPTDGVRLETIRAEPLLAAMPDAHRLSAASRVSLAELANDPFVVFPRERAPNVADHLVALCRTAGFSPRVAQEALQYPTILGLVWAGVGVALVPESVRDSVGGGVSFAALADDGAVSRMSLASAATPLPGSTALVDAFRAVVFANRFGSSVGTGSGHGAGGGPAVLGVPPRVG